MEIKLIKVQIVWAFRTDQRIVNLQVPQGTTIREVVDRSGLSQYFPDANLSDCDFGIFGVRKTLYFLLKKARNSRRISTQK